MIEQSLKQQQLAANPNVSAWVSASAGTGKTKVLIDRLLALLLNGVDPARILCLTFTKAAAAEMQHRLLCHLEKWILEDEITLFNSLKSLLTTDPTTEQLQRARQLYTLVLEAPLGMNIVTIHGFCQRLLNRFPLEAVITPHFKVIDESEAIELLEEAKRSTLKTLLTEEKETLAKLLVTHFKDGSFQEILEELLNNRRHLRPLMARYKEEKHYAKALCEKLDLPQNLDLLNPSLLKDYITHHYQLSEADRKALLEIAAEKSIPLLNKWLESGSEARGDLFQDYAQLYLTSAKKIRKKGVLYEPEAETVYRLQRTLDTIELAQKSFCAFHIGYATFQTYQHFKSQQNSLDYEDLIEKAIALLTQEQISPWILYKLDGGIDHLLVDEAQDTNPDQWRVILALTEDFFMTNKRHRTLFVVGDVKQSIYSFQGASPRDFINLRQFFKEKCYHAQQPWYDLELEVSFRSTPEILCLVDKVVNDPSHQKDIQFQETCISHLPFRSQHEGVVKLLPAVLKKTTNETNKPWTIPDQYRLPATALEEVCEQISRKIQQLLSQGEILPSTGKLVQPKDILILVKQRGKIAPHLIRHLKKQGIPVSGVDRFSLSTHLVVQDLLVLAEFLLLPQDDLSLASLLKSPLLGMSEEDLLDLAATRQASLWQELSFKQQEKPIYQYCFNYLKELLDKLDYLSPFDLYHLILFKKEGLIKFRQRFGREADEALFEFLGYAFDQSQNRSITLQQYIGNIKKDNHEVKRDNADASVNQIRLMTVHGSKGLQAPIVFMVEKFKTRTTVERLLWEVDKAGICHFMIARPANESDTPYTVKLKDSAEILKIQEDKRLLYVALTRAQDHLYVTGFGESKIPESSWYNFLIPFVMVEEPIPVIDYKKTEPFNRPLTNWLRNPIPPRSQIRGKEASEEIFLSEAAERGVHIHKLFELLLSLDPSQYQSALETYMKSQNLESDHINPSQILNIMQSGLLEPFLQGISIAELEIAQSDGKLIRLDRVVVDSNTIKILDFKTSEKYPSEVEKTPKLILRQLSQYAAALKEIYPKHQIECYLLWTAGPVLHYVSDEILRK